MKKHFIIDGNNLNTDYFSYANRQWVVGSGDVTNTYNTCGICVTSASGCMDSTATNYDPSATTDDGSCIYNPPSSSICEDFDSFQPGDPIAQTSPDWETWGSITAPNPPYADDANVTNNMASSGNNSLYFES